MIGCRGARLSYSTSPLALVTPAEANGATVATTSGTGVTLLETAWTIQASPYEFWYPDERFCPMVKQGEGLVVRCQTTAADDISIAVTFFLEEL